MERLTNRDKEIPLPNADNALFWARVHEKLARYEDAEEQAYINPTLDRRKREGLCQRCGGEMDREGRAWCSECVARDRESKRYVRRLREKRGLCTKCGKNPVTEGKTCAACRAYYAAARLRYERKREARDA